MSDAKCAGPFRVANPEGIVPETKIDAFVKRLNAGLIRLASGPFRVEPWCSLHYIYSGRQIVGNIEGDHMMVSPVVPPHAAEWMREAWRAVGGSCAADRTVTQSPVAAPQISPRVQRFLDTLTGSRFTCRTGHGEFVGGPFTAKFYPKERSIEIAGNGVQIGVIRSDRLIAYNQIVGEDAANSLEHIWRELDCTAPETPPRIQRFLAALTDHEIDFKDDYNYTVKAPFTTTVLPSQNVTIVLGNGVEFGEVRGDDFTPDTAMPCDIRAILRHMWREIIREESLLERLAALEAECAEKTRQIDQIAAILKGRK